MPDPCAVDWRSLIDDVLLQAIRGYAATAGPALRSVFLTGSYVRERWNPERPNVNLYFVADSADTVRIRFELGVLFSGIRRQCRSRGIDFIVDCHPFTISQRDTDWSAAPLLTLTTKVFDAAQLPARLNVSPTIGYGWWQSHRILHGDPDFLAVFELPPARDEAWFRGAHAALCHYRRMLDHLPWALDPQTDPARLLEETCRYAEETIKDGVHFGATDEEVVTGAETEILHDWAGRARDFFLDRYGPDGGWAVDTVAELKASVSRPGHSTDEVRRRWQEAIRVWEVVWSRYAALVSERNLAGDLRRLLTWM